MKELIEKIYVFWEKTEKLLEVEPGRFNEAEGFSSGVYDLYRAGDVVRLYHDLCEVYGSNHTVLDEVMIDFVIKIFEDERLWPFENKYREDGLKVDPLHKISKTRSVLNHWGIKENEKIIEIYRKSF